MIRRMMDVQERVGQKMLVVANRLAYLAERHNLLPDNHFGARKKRSCEQAINVLVERIYEAWRNRKVVSLVTFDV
jgi:hypothetical protein